MVPRMRPRDARSKRFQCNKQLAGMDGTSYLEGMDDENIPKCL